MTRPRTRMELLAGRAQLALARQGQALLEQKRDALLRELYREIRSAYAQEEELRIAAGAARAALEEARAWLAPETVAAAARAAEGEVAVDVQPVDVMGVAVPIVAAQTLVRAPGARRRDPLLSGATLEAAALRYEEALTVAIRVASAESRVRRLGREVRRTSSRVNALRTRVVPELVAETRAIELALEQRERDDHFRLKLVKRAREARTKRPLPGPV